LYELPATGGFPDSFGKAPDTFEDGEIASLLSIVPGPGPAGKQNNPVTVGDNPTCRAIRTSSTRTPASRISASSGSAEFPAD